MPQVSKHEDDLEGTLVGLLGIMLVISATGLVYFLIARSAPRDLESFRGDQISKWIWGIFGTFFFLYGAVGVIKGKIGIGWGMLSQIRTILEGAGAFTSSVGTAIGGLLFLITAAIYFYPPLSVIIHPLAILLCGFVSIISSWICGAIIRELGY